MSSQGRRSIVIRWLREERGNVLLFTTALVVPVMLVLAGLAIDMAYLGEVKTQVQRSMDAAALAGAGNLGFNSSYFPGAYAAATNYALLNPFRVGTIALAPSPGNADVPPASGTGNIVLGIWNGTTFAPSLDGTQVNAVKCQYARTIPTSFLRLLGVTTLPVSAQAIAWAPPPATPPPTSCVFPVGLSQCFFNGNTSLGCGSTVTFISSSDSSAVGANTAAWVNLMPGASNVSAGGLNTTPPGVLGQVAAAVNGTCSGAQINTGDPIPASNGELNSVVNYLMDHYPQLYATSPILTVFKQDGVTKAYEGHGWKVYVPVIDTGSSCPPGAVNGEKTIVGWTTFVITNVLNSAGSCAVANHWPGNAWDAHCFTDKNGTATSLPPGWSGQKGIFGYYDCEYTPSPPAPVAGPISATATLKLVK
jgi:Flp pilus assembly protein TadG